MLDKVRKEWVKVAVSLIGAPAVKYSGPKSGNSLAGFDCSGFVQFCLLRAGFDLSKPLGYFLRHTEEFFDFFGILVHPEVRQEGDLVFFTSNGFIPSHVGIYLSNGNMVHSSINGESAVKIDSIDDFVARSRFELKPGQRYNYAGNPIGYKRPAAFGPNRYQRPA